VDRPRQTTVLDVSPTSCGVDCLLIPGSPPGTHTRLLGVGDNPHTAANSVPWPDTLVNATVVLLNVTGTIPRSYVNAMTASFVHLQGTPYKPIDADGAIMGGLCGGEIRTNFRVSGFEPHVIRSCTVSSTNNDVDNTIVAEKTVAGRLRGSGSVLRVGMNQPSWPGWFNCLNGPCVIAGVGQQTITMHPWMERLSLAAAPMEVYEGDSVLFTASATSGSTIAAGSQRWAWVPHNRKINGTLVNTSDTQTGVCANGAVACRVPVFKTGNMYLRATVNPASVAEQAFAKVVVKPLALIATPTPRAVGGSLDSVKVIVRTVPHRELSSISIVVSPGLMALRLSSFSGSGSGSGTATCDAQAGECDLSGGSAPARLTVTATTVQGVTLTTTVVVDTLPCPTGNPVLDSKEMRALIDSIWKIGGNQGSAPGRRERGALLIDSAGVLVARHLPLDSNSSPCTTTWPTSDRTQFIPPRWIAEQMTIVSVLHTHPFTFGEKLPTNCPANLAGQRAGYGPSLPDWHNVWSEMNSLNNSYRIDNGRDLFAPYYQPLVIEPEHLWLIDPRSIVPWVKTIYEGDTLQKPDTVIVGNNVQGWKRTKPLSNNSCVSKVNVAPSIVR
jgi:hypothetical protein